MVIRAGRCVVMFGFAVLLVGCGPRTELGVLQAARVGVAPWIPLQAYLPINECCRLKDDSAAIGSRADLYGGVALEREQRRVATPFGRIGVKLVWDGEGGAQVSAEYDDCKRAARRAGVPLRDVVRAAEEAGRGLL